MGICTIGLFKFAPLSKKLLFFVSFLHKTCRGPLFFRLLQFFRFFSQHFFSFCFFWRLFVPVVLGMSPVCGGRKSLLWANAPYFFFKRFQDAASIRVPRAPLLQRQIYSLLKFISCDHRRGQTIYLQLVHVILIDTVQEPLHQTPFIQAF
jgi:hypothetical protein